MTHLGFSFGAPNANANATQFGFGAPNASETYTLFGIRVNGLNANATPFAYKQRNRILKEVQECELFLEDGCEFLGGHTKMSSLIYNPDETVAKFRLDFYQVSTLPIRVSEPRVFLDMEHRFHIQHPFHGPRLVLVGCSDSNYRGFYEHKVDMYNEIYHSSLWSPTMTLHKTCLLFAVSVNFLEELMQVDADSESPTMTEEHHDATL